MMMNSLLVRQSLQPGATRISLRVLALAVVVLGAGCQREEIQVYTVGKEVTRPMVAQSGNPHGGGMGGSGMGAPRPRAQVSWTLPGGWKETGAGQMSVASFSIQGEGGTEAQVTITPLAKLGGRDADIVNMWREQVGLKPLERDEALKQFEKVEVGGESASMFQIEGAPVEGSTPAKIVTAIVHRDDASWFFKFAGDAALVTAQKPVFIEFLKSIRMKDAPSAASPAAASDPGSQPGWIVPSQWRQVAAGQMQVARFAVPERGGAKAEVFVSVFPNDTGGTLANVNRWRRQIGLGEIGEGELGPMVSPLDPASPGAILVEMVSDSKKLLGAVVPRDGSYWFYKLLGDAAAVTPEKEAFVAFAKSKP